MKAVLRKCVACVRYSARTENQLMGELPAARVTTGYPFERSGVDYAGSAKVRRSKSRGNGTLKGYISIFVCT